MEMETGTDFRRFHISARSVTRDGFGAFADPGSECDSSVAAARRTKRLVAVSASKGSLSVAARFKALPEWRLSAECEAVQ